MKGRRIKGFGKRLAKIRRSRGLTQVELGEKVNVSDRVIAYYEHENAQPPGSMIVDLAKALGTSSDELYGLKPAKLEESPKTARLVKRLRRITELPVHDQKAVLKYMDALLEKQAAKSK